MKPSLVASEPSSRAPLDENPASTTVAVSSLLLLGGILATWLWTRAGELMLDFGREASVFWQMSQGRVLYRDLDYRFGPMAPVVNSLLLRLFGADIRTILTANLLVLAITVVLLYRLLLRMGGRFPAIAGTTFFLAIFGLSNGTGIAQYNFLTPYNHDATYGLAAALAALLCAARFDDRRQMLHCLLSGFFLGLAFLCKIEIFLAAAVALGTGILAGTMTGRWSFWNAAISTAAGLAIPLGIALGILLHYMPARTALYAVANGLQYLVHPRQIDSPFYRLCMGTDHLALNAARMVLSAIGYALFIAIGAWISGLGRSASRPARAGRLAGAILAALLIGDYLAFGWIWSNLDRGLPVAMLAATVVCVAYLRRHRHDAGAGPSLLPLRFVVFALILLAKMFLFARTYHYGFVLAVPAAMVAVVALTGWIPARLDAAGRSGAGFRFIAICLLLVIVAHRLMLTYIRMNAREARVQLALGGSLPLSPPDVQAAQAVRYLSDSTHVPPGATLAVFPDAAGLELASGHLSSIPFTSCNPFEIQMTGELTIIESLSVHPPDFIVLVDTDESEYGAAIFGRDFGGAIESWIRSHYHTVWSAPSGTSQNAKIRGFEILRRIQ